MKYTCVAVLAGWFAVSGGFTSVVAAECGPPTEEEITTQQAAIFAEDDVDRNKNLSLSEFATLHKTLRSGPGRATLHVSPHQ